MEQWFFRITDYAQALLDDLETLDWPESIKARQRNWIGRSDGAEISFRVAELDLDVPVFTTRPDTLFGATFFVLAPEHELVEQLAMRAENGEEIRAYVQRAAVKKTEERAAAEVKTGVFTGFHVVNPVNGERLPVYVADYVLTDYGTGAIMAVPGHDERDFAFAQAYELPVREVVRSAGGEAVELPYVSKSEDDVLVELGRVRRAVGARGRSADRREARGGGSRRASRSTTGCATGAGRGSATGAARSPSSTARATGSSPCRRASFRSLLPDLEDFKPKGKPPLAQAEDWINVPCPKCGEPGEARGRDDGHVRRLGVVLPALLRPAQRPGAVRARARRLLEPRRPVHRRRRPRDDAHDLRALLRQGAERHRACSASASRSPLLLNGWVTIGGKKMSKRAGNAVGPDEYVEQYGADPVRLYILFIGPADQDMEWTTTGVEGMSRFVRRLWRIVNEVAESAPQGERRDGALTRKAHATIAKVTDDVGRRYAFNTAISAVMELVNELSREPHGAEARFAAETAVSLIQPYAPHVTEELWQRLGRERLWEEPWPVADTSLLERDDLRARRAGERQGAGPGRGARRRVGGRARRAARESERVRSASTARRCGRRSSVPRSSSTSCSGFLRDELTHTRHEAVTHA